NLSYLPSNEVIQEFKVQNNSFSAEFGSNGGTIVNVLMKSGTNNFHGSGWWFGQRTELNANDFFSNRFGVPRSDSTRDQYGFSVTGPIIKNKTFFLFDLERVRQNDKGLVSARVPTDLERRGDFRQTLTQNDNGNVVNVQLFNQRDFCQFDRSRWTTVVECLSGAHWAPRLQHVHQLQPGRRQPLAEHAVRHQNRPSAQREDAHDGPVQPEQFRLYAARHIFRWDDQHAEYEKHRPGARLDHQSTHAPDQPLWRGPLLSERNF